MNATVIIPTHAGAGRIGRLLDSLRGQTTEAQVIVVDNASTDGTPGVLARYPEVEVVRADRNLGYGRAVNLAAKRADGDALVLVNDDCVCDPGFTAAIAGPLEGDVAMSAAVMRDAADGALIDTAGMELSATLLVFDYLHGERIAALDGAGDPVGPSGAAAGFDRTAFLEAGGFDEALFAYWEDVDLVLRLRREGARCALAAGALGTHLHSATLGAGSPEKNRLMGFGRAYLLRKWSVLHGTRAIRALAEEAALCAGQIVIDRNPAGVAGRVRGWRAAHPSYAYPAAAVAGHRRAPMLGDLRRRLARRRRTRRLRRERESPAEGLARQLGRATLPDSIAVGGGNAFFVGGTLELEPGTASDVEILVDGVRSEAPVTVVRPGPGAPAYWWTDVELERAAERRDRSLSLRVNGAGAPRTLELGKIATCPEPPRPAADPAVESRIAGAVAAASESPGPLVAICMASYEPDPGLFERQIESIRQQTHRGWICLISDDGSSAEHLSVISETIGEDPRLVLIENAERVGFYRNYERALGAVPAEAAHVALADQDDRWFAEKLESLLAAIGGRDLAYSDMRLVSEDGSVLSDTYWTRRRNNYEDFASLLVGNTVTGAASLFRRDLLSRALPFPPARSDGYHDHWIALTALAGRGIAYVDRPLHDYVQHGKAAQGHERANTGARYLQPLLILMLAWQGLKTLLGRPGAKGWADRYFGMYTRTVLWARVLLMRSAGSLTAKQRRVLERVVNAERSPTALLWLAGRSLRPIWGANEAFGREILVLSSILWERALEARHGSRNRRISAPGR